MATIIPKKDIRIYGVGRGGVPVAKSKELKAAITIPATTTPMNLCSMKPFLLGLTSYFTTSPCCKEKGNSASAAIMIRGL